MPHFEGDVEARWLVQDGDDRGMILLKDFAFVDSSKIRWQALKGDEIDGASIPEMVWSQVMGTPFIGEYRRASVVHDVACTKKLRTAKEAHRMFYEAMLADGTPKARAMLFYTAVRLFGPKWDTGDKGGALGILQSTADKSRSEDAIDFDELEAALDKVVEK